jgi:lactate dehydrogenase-like 2-hydroxyacid dehydrogenase
VAGSLLGSQDVKFQYEVPIAEYVVMVILMFLTRIEHFQSMFRDGNWSGTGRVGGAPHDEAQGKTVGLIGYGHIGQEIAKRAASFGMLVRAIKQRPQTTTTLDRVSQHLGGPEDLEASLAMSHFVVIACPLTAKTRDGLGAKELALMGADGVLINVAR